MAEFFLPQLVSRLRLDTGGLRQGLSKAERSLQQSARNMESIGRRMSIGFSLPVVAGFGFAVKAASDLNEALDANRVLFGDHAADAEEWAKGLAQSAGIAASTALEANAAIGNMLNTVGLAPDTANDMSRSLVQLAGDMASFSNQDPSEMLDRLRSGLAGEAEPLRRFGVLLSAAEVEAKAMELGLVGANGELTEAAKVQARYAIILEQTAVQQGNFIDTADGVANSTRRAKAEAQNAAASFGEALLPITRELLKVLSKVAGVFDDMPGPVKTALVALLALGAAVGPILLIIAKLRLMRLELKKVATDSNLAGLSLGRLGTKAKFAGKLLGGLVIAWEAYDFLANKGERERAKLEEHVQKLAEQVPDVDTAVRLLTDGGEDLQTVLNGGASAFDNVSDEAKTTALFMGSLAEKMGLTDDELVQIIKDAYGVVPALEDVGDEGTKTGRKLKGFASLTRKEFRAWRKGVVESMDPVHTALDRLAGKTKLTAEKIINAFKRQERNLDDYNDNLKEVANRNIPDDVLQQIVDMGNDGAGILAVLADATKREFREIINSMKAGQEEAIRTSRILGNLQPPKDLKVIIDFDLDDKALMIGGKEFSLGLRAQGGPVFAGSPYIVGENGPELFIPDVSGKIIPNSQTSTARSGSVTIAPVFNISGANAQDIADAVEERMARIAARQINDQEFHLQRLGRMRRA